MIKRQINDLIINNIRPGFINVIYGPRRVGKTVLLQSLTKKYKKEDCIFFNGDTLETRNALSSTSEIELSKLIDKFNVVVVDEAQRIPNIGLSLKIIVDKYPEKIFFVSGSSSLSLSKGIKESLTGRYQIYKLYPLSTEELTENLSDFEKKTTLEEQLIYGGYPYLLQLGLKDQKRKYLKSLIDDYLFNDIKNLKEIISEEIIKKLTILLAFQIGSLVSFNELSKNLGIDVKTVARYISLLKKSFVIFEVGSYSTNPRKELAKSKKYYFWDLGIRNALIDQFLPLDSRADVGFLWENFLAIERIKKNEYQGIVKEYYFWRNYEKAEIDWIEKKENTLLAYEFKWIKKKDHTPKNFKENYKIEATTIDRNNYLDFLTK